MDTQATIPIILDTDIGSDIDDALCLAYLLGQPRCELVGVTTVSGQPLERAMLVDAMCRLVGRTDIPIHSGAEQPLMIPQHQPHAPQSEVLAEYPHREDFAPNTAVEFLRETIHARPGEITLLAIGPLTNVALLFATDPEIPRLLKSLMIMGGVFTSCIAGLPRSEWNLLVDPHAADIVYRAPVASHTSIGLDVTMQCRMNAEECRQQLVGSTLGMAAKMAEVWFRQAKEITFHDPLAGAVIFEPELCTYQAGQVEIELLSRQVSGMSHWLPWSETKPHSIAVDVHADKFFEHYFATAK